MPRALLLVPLALVALLAVPAAPVTATSHEVIQPGDVVTFGNAQCTLNFVFDGVGPLAGKVFIGSAAHCISGRLGIGASTTGIPNFGTVFYTGDYGNSVNGGTAVKNNIPGEQLDFLLIEVKPQYHSHVFAGVAGYASMPTGATKAQDTTFPDQIFASGHGIGFGTLRATRENRTGVMTSDSHNTWKGEIPITPGDSGGPILHESGKALGVVSGTSTGCCALPLHYWHGPTVDGVLAELNALGYPVVLRTV